MEKTSGGGSGGIYPLRSSPAAAFCLSVSSFVFLCRLLANLLGGLFIQSFLGLRLICSDDCWQRIRSPIAPRDPTAVC